MVLCHHHCDDVLDVVDDDDADEAAAMIGCLQRYHYCCLGVAVDPLPLPPIAWLVDGRHDDDGADVADAAMQRRARPFQPHGRHDRCRASLKYPVPF